MNGATYGGAVHPGWSLLGGLGCPSHPRVVHLDVQQIVNLRREQLDVDCLCSWVQSRVYRADRALLMERARVRLRGRLEPPAKAACSRWRQGAYLCRFDSCYFSTQLCQS